MKSWWRLSALVVVLLGLQSPACGDGRPGTSPMHDAGAAETTQAAEDPLGPAVPLVSPPLGVSKLVERVRYGFRPEAGELVAERPTHLARIAGARLELRARQMGPGGPEQSAPLLVRTRAVHRGERASADAAAARVAEDGHVAIERGPVVEHLRNRDDGVEQSWSFAARPEGSGDLVVSVELAGLVHLATTATGVHFVDPTSGLGVRYGIATWIDAEGRRTPVPLEYSGGILSLRVAERVVDGAAYPAVLDPTISAEFGIDQPVTSPAYGSQRYPSIASDGTGYLAVWSDSRSGTSACMATRVSGAGSVLDPEGLVVVDQVWAQTDCRVAFIGTSYLVSWKASDSSASSSDVFAARVSSGGNVLDPSGIGLSTSGNGSAPRVAGAGNTGLVVWSDNGLWAKRVSSTGAVLDASPLEIEPPGNPTGHSQAVAGSGTSFLVTYVKLTSTAYDVFGVLVGTDGSVGSELTIVAQTDDDDDPAVAAGTNGFYVAWRSETPAGGSVRSVQGTTVSPTGVPGTIVDIAPDAYVDYDGLAITHAGGEYRLVWEDRRLGYADAHVLGARLDDGGNLLATEIPVDTSPGASTSPSIACSSTGCMTVYERGGSAPVGRQVVGARHDSTLGVLGTFDLTQSKNAELDVGLAWGTSSYLVVWRDSRNGTSWDLYGARVEHGGNVLDPNGIAIETGPSNQGAPKVAFDGTQWTVGWLDDVNAVNGSDRGVFAKRISTAGGVIDSAPIEVLDVGPWVEDLKLAGGGGKTLFAWQQGVISATVMVSLMDATGTPLGQSSVHQASSYSLTDPSAAYDGNQFLVGWTDSRDGDLTLYVSRIAADGTNLDPAGIPVSADVIYYSKPALGFDGKSFWAVFEYDGVGFDTQDIGGVRISPAGAVLDPTPIRISAASGEQSDPDIVATGDGSSSLVVWLTDGKLFGSWVDQAGAVLDPSGISVSAEPGDHGAPSLASAGGGRVAIGYSRVVSSALVERARLRFVSSGAVIGTSCLLNAECGTRHCADSVCCDTACDLPCQTCNATSGRCEPVTNAPDPDTCTGAQSCSAAGACKRALAETCSDAAECASGFCVDGVCCDTACNGVCQACKAVLKASGSDGSCGSAATGSDPHDDCAALPESTCNTTGVCNAEGACELWPDGTVCGAAQCDPQGNLVSSLCSGYGQCNQSLKACFPYACQSGACATSCTSDDDCARDAHCEAGSCEGSLANGEACSAGQQCDSGVCADGVCCNTACSGQCEACDVAPNEGTCVPVLGAPSGSRPACEGAGSACGGECDGVNRAACRYPGSTTACGTPTCADGVAKSSSCDGQGACVPNADERCSPFACDAESCLTSCQDDEECGRGYRCDQGDCIPSTGACVQNDTAVQDTSTGVIRPCTPYLCSAGQCSISCAGSAQCASGYVCDTTQSPGQCIEAEPQAPSDEGGCACRAADSRSPAAPGALLGLLFAGLLRLRRRRPGHRR